MKYVLTSGTKNLRNYGNYINARVLRFVFSDFDLMRVRFLRTKVNKKLSISHACFGFIKNLKDEFKRLAEDMMVLTADRPPGEKFGTFPKLN